MTESFDGYASILAERLRKKARMYQQDDGEPGPLGYNCWGWRNIRKTLMAEADWIERYDQEDTA